MGIQDFSKIDTARPATGRGEERMAIGRTAILEEMRNENIKKSKKKSFIELNKSKHNNEVIN